MAQQQDRIFIVASTGLAARALVMAQLGFSPTEAGLVRHFAAPSALASEVKRRRQRGLHVPDVLWYGRDMMVPISLLEYFASVARSLGMECKRIMEHPRYQSYWLSPDAPSIIHAAGARLKLAETVALHDWNMPHSMRNRIRPVRGPEQLYGVQGAGHTIWLMPDFRDVSQSDRTAMFELAYHRGFEIKQYMEHPAYVPRKV